MNVQTSQLTSTLDKLFLPKTVEIEDIDMMRACVDSCACVTPFYNEDMGTSMAVLKRLMHLSADMSDQEL